MGEWDYYCFLCAAGFYRLDEPSEEGPDDELDHDNHEIDELDPRPEIENSTRIPPLLAEETRAWLEDFRVIGENAAATGVRRCYLSGRAQISEFGTAVLSKGHDPVAPEIDSDPDSDGTVVTQLYRNFDADNDTGALPVHDSCLRVLQRAAMSGKGGRFAEDADFGFRLDEGCGFEIEHDYDHTIDEERAERDSLLLVERTGRLDIDAFFHCLSSKRKAYQSSLLLDYGSESMNEMAREQFFYIQAEHEPYVLDPFNIKQVRSFAEDLPLLGTTTAFQTNTKTPSSDPFSRLPLELITMICHHLPQEALTPAILTSRSLSRVRTCNWFWRRRIKVVMPWAWEVHELKRDIDWYQAYIALAQEVKDPYRSSIPALGNRKRVWSACEQVLMLYHGTESEDVTVYSAMLNGAKLEGFPHVATSTDTAKTIKTVWFPLDEMFVHSAKKLIVYWKDRSLAGLAITPGRYTTTVGNTTNVDVSESMLIAQDDWIRSLTLHVIVEENETSAPGEVPRRVSRHNFVVGLTATLLSGAEVTLGKIEGHKRMLIPQQGRAIAGMKVEMTGGIITRLGILEHPFTGLNQIEKIEQSPLLTYLWTDKLPLCRGITFDGYQEGYWGVTAHQDLVPITCLWFGSEQTEGGDLPYLGTIRGISGSHDARSWRVHREIDGANSMETAGPVREEHEMRFFPIQGCNGERIIGFETDIGPYVTGVRLITNKGRQCIWGSNNNSKYPYDAKQGRYITGIYCSHGYTSARTLMTTFSIMTAGITVPNQASAPPDFDALKDRRGLPWEPSPPPSCYTEVNSTYYGTAAHGERATFLDFARLVDRISGLLAASVETVVGSLGGFSIVYTDGGTVFCGATTRVEDLDNPNMASLMLTGSARREEQQQVEIPHVPDEAEARASPAEFDAHGEKIQKVRVWAAAYLHGIQFVTETGRESPKWGKCGGPVTLEVVAGSILEGGRSAPALEDEEVDEEWAAGTAGIKNEVVGIKVILGSRRYERGYADVRPLAVEIMGRRMAEKAVHDTGV